MTSSSKGHELRQLSQGRIVLSALAIINGWNAWATLAFVSAAAIACQI